MSDLPERYRFLEGARVVPVIVIDDIDDALPIARALVAGGLTNLEVTLRTDCALDAIAAISESVEGATVGAGTVLNGIQLDAARSAGAKFIVSPGVLPDLLSTCAERNIPLLPGAVTASEVMMALDYGYRILKFFPAGTSGGPAAIKALGGPFVDVRFMPTGGINLNNLKDYLSLKNVIAAGGSWMLPSDMIARKDWGGIETLARQAVTAANAID
jgi:2-dehydro-3-deoxyphosphogluconate aldolase/(4S)-4-hydroxy-2-oxoglutarate aldolase